MKINEQQLKQLVEAAIFVSEQPISKEKLRNTVLLDFGVSAKALNGIIAEIKLDYQPRGIILQETASGLRFVTQPSLSQWLSNLWQENAPRYSKALLETLALVVYKQPITRGEIEQVRGVAVSSNIMKTLLERQWVKVVGHKEVPGRPALYATTSTFLDYFGLSSLTDLPDASAFDAAIIEAQEAVAEDITLNSDQSNTGDEPATVDSVNQEQVH